MAREGDGEEDGDEEGDDEVEGGNVACIMVAMEYDIVQGWDRDSGPFEKGEIGWRGTQER
jgi:hypothetical protein